MTKPKDTRAAGLRPSGECRECGAPSPDFPLCPDCDTPDADERSCWDRARIEEYRRLERER